ncbi:Metal-dependent membrane protease [Prochlorococcus marinus subsp. marinus str. CCMP1375]|uniref:Metal-dependent membrane protease n=1 Tax=Prochlorococcus marinus (strain SARG / CCMP1375 / SS120) TaxID=167539 RepID=Q7VA16_PROMA|nr:Metal-dependent membrane protease [Prochlorococcus marinus subsp. marinus str. CCMP1375]
MINLIAASWKNWLLQRRRWIPTVSHLPFLYFCGWLIVRPLGFLFEKIEQNDLSLVGTLFTFTFFLFTLPSWVKFRWRYRKPSLALGLSGLASKHSVRSFFRGFCWAGVLLVCILAPIFLGSWGDLVGGGISIANFINAVFLGIGVGFAEELVFRSWLWGEANLLVGASKGIFLQAGIFSLAHLSALIKSDLSFVELISLLIGLFLLGLVLALRRILDNGSLSGCIGLHGGLVGLWFLIDADLIEILPTTPTWIVGPGSVTPNPIGGLIGIVCLALTLFCYRTAFAIAERPSNGARNASAKGATP